MQRLADVHLRGERVRAVLRRELYDVLERLRAEPVVQGAVQEHGDDVHAELRLDVRLVLDARHVRADAVPERAALIQPPFT